MYQCTMMHKIFQCMYRYYIDQVSMYRYIYIYIRTDVLLGSINKIFFVMDKSFKMTFF